MKRIGLLSDTHGYFDPKVFDFFKDVDEIWHAGDVGNEAVMDELEAFKPTRAVYGNIDDHNLRKRIPEVQAFTIEKTSILMIHIGGYPGRYSLGIRTLLKEHKPTIFICGHSHILKVIYDKSYKALHINPGAFGKSGFHKVRTMLRFIIDGSDIKELEIFESDR